MELREEGQRVDVASDGSAPVEPGSSEAAAAPGRPVGEVLRELRIARRLTLKTTAERAGISESFLSQLERGRVGTSLKSLQGIAGALGVEVGDLFRAPEQGRTSVVRHDGRPEVSIGSLAKYQLTPVTAAQVEVFAGSLAPGGTAGEEPYSHGDSEELLLVISGEIKAVVGDETWTLRTGDSIFYRSSEPHTLHASEDGAAEVIWIIAPPSY
jgi:transcriptional regulator with XRE-family HTH domain